MNFLKGLNKLHYLSAWCCCIFMLQRIYFFPHCSKPCLQIFCKSTIIKSQKKYQGGKVYSVFTHITVAKVINKNIQCYDTAQACTVWDRALNVWQTFQNIPPLLMRVVHATAVENPSTHQLTILCKHCVLTAVLATNVFREYTTPHTLVLTIMMCSIPHTFLLYLPSIWGHKAASQTVVVSLSLYRIGFNSVHSMWDLWWMKWQWDSFYSQYLAFPCWFQSANAPTHNSFIVHQHILLISESVFK